MPKPKAKPDPEKIKMKPLDSTSLTAIGFDESTNTLKVSFKESGETYIYNLVPTQVYEGLIAAESKGAYFQKWIRAKPYPFTKVED